MNGQNNWNVSYSSICFMEQVLSTHTAVDSFRRENDIQFHLVRKNGLSNLNVVFVDEYILGDALAYSIIEEFEGVEVIVNNGYWNLILLNWRKFAERTGVVILKMADFMGAINVEDLRQYVTRDESEEGRRERRECS